MIRTRSGTIAPEQTLRRWLLSFWAVPALVGTVGLIVVPSRLNPQLSWLAILASQAAMWGTWAIWTWLLWRVGDVLTRRRTTVPTQWLVYLALGTLVITVQILWHAVVMTTVGLAEPRGLESTLVIGLRTNGDYFVVVYAALVLAQSAVRWLATLQSERIHAARLEADLAQAQMAALRSQLQPHFLFNALNSVVTLISRDPAQAQRMTVQLSELLRLSLRTAGHREVPLEQELELTRRYLAIEQIRFADRLTVEWRGSAPPDVGIPAFALQPLVENALVHGIARSTHGGTIRITLDVDAEVVTLQVWNSGPGLWPPSTARGNGTALANLRERLERLYGSGASVRLQDALNDAQGDAGTTGVVATLRLPRTAVAGDAQRSSETGRGVDAATVPSSADHGLLPT